MFGKDVGTAYRAQEMCCKIAGCLLQSAFFQLLSPWAQKQKLDFSKDAINTLVVLNSHFWGQSLTDFLLKLHDFKIQLITKKSFLFLRPSKIHGRSHKSRDTTAADVLWDCNNKKHVLFPGTNGLCATSKNISHPKESRFLGTASWTSK